MKNQPKPNWTPTRGTSKDGASYPKQVPPRVFFAEEELTQELVEEVLSKKLSAGPGKSLNPEIDPAEIEAIYLWFFS